MRGIFSSFSALGGFGSHDDEPGAAGDTDDAVDSGPPPSPVGQDERRMQVRAYNHWAGMLGDRNFPAIEDLDPADLPDFGPYSVLLDFGNGIENPSVAFLGSRLAVECGADVSIDRLGDVPSLSLLSRITDHYMQILANQAPIGFEAEFVNGRGLTVLYRGILLPFSSDDETIDFIYGVINWKEVADQQTADALLLEIDRALSGGSSTGEAADPAPRELTRAASRVGGGAVLDLGEIGHMADDPQGEDAPDEDEEDEAAEIAEWEEDVIDLRNAGELGEDAFEEDGEDQNERLPSLVAMRIDKGERRKAPAVLTLDAGTVAPVMRQAVNAPMAFFEEYGAAEFAPAVSAATYERAPVSKGAEGKLVPFAAYGPEGEPADEEERRLPVLHTGAAAPVQADTPAAMLQRIAAAMEAGDEATGLHDCLASARDLADALRNSEDRSRSALYKAVSRAYDVSLAAAEAPEEWAELLADSGLAMQERAPMTPVVKLVFGADYDKTRVTEYAAVLAHARRNGVARGELRHVLQRAEGGLKAIVASERALRRGTPPARPPGLRTDVAERLRGLAPVMLHELPLEGPEFALVMVRRTPEGVAVLGEVPEDAALLARAARQLRG